MQMQRRYEKTPIKEAIIDLRVTLPEGFTVNQIADIHPSIKDGFPTIEPFYKGVGAFFYQPGSSLKVDTSERQIGFWFRSGDNVQTCQTTLEGFSFNRLAPYESWEKFSSEAKDLWGIYTKICNPIQVTRVAVRYINQINIPANEVIELKDYLNTVPEVSSKLSQKTLQSFFMQLQIPQQDLGCMLTINEAIAPPADPEMVTVILDRDLFRQQVWDSDDEDIWSLLEKLRDRKNEVFEASITDKTRELIN